jgi:Lsr2
MAQVTKVRLIDDLDGSEADESVSFTLDGTALEIDLSAANAEKLREILAPYIAAARHGDRKPVRRRQPVSAASAAPPESTAPIREWAAANGFEVSGRGRVSGQVMDAYRNRGADDGKVEKPARPMITDPFTVSFA